MNLSSFAPRPLRPRTAVVGSLAVALLLTGCGATADTAEPASSSSIDVSAEAASNLATDDADATDATADADGDADGAVDAATATGEAISTGFDCDAAAAAFVTRGSANDSLPDPEVAATCDDGDVVVTANGIPDYTYIETSPGTPAAQDISFTLPASPVMAAEVTDIPRLGSVAIAVNGVPIYGPTEGQGGDVLSLEGGLSECGSHNGPTGFHIHLAGTSTTTDCLHTPDEVASGPQLVGFAFDGVPIYTGNDQYTSSWQLTDESVFATDTWSAHTYVEGSGDLDECNGLTAADGTYAYYTTDTFPYVIGCYRGEVELAAAGAGPGGGPGGGP